MPDDAPRTAQWLTIDEAADRIGTSRRTLNRLRAAGKLRAYRLHERALPRFRVEDVDALMAPDTGSTP